MKQTDRLLVEYEWNIMILDERVVDRVVELFYDGSLISRAHLVTNKRSAGRPKDLLDLDLLEKHAPRAGSSS